MSLLSKFLEDSEDWIKEQFDWSKSITTSIVKQAVKQFRLAWQNKANQYINEAEDKMTDEAVALLRAHLPELNALPDAQIEMACRKVYRKYIGYIKDEFGADWIQDA